MASIRQEEVVTGVRGKAGQLDNDFNDFEAYIARFDVLNLENPNFANGYFSTPREITANDHLGMINAYNALKAAAGQAWLDFRAALRKGRG